MQRARGVSPAIAIACGCLVAVGSAASGESGFSPVQTLRSGPPGASVEVGAVAATRRDVAVVWQERIEGHDVLRIRTSRDGGATFRPRRLVEEREGGSSSSDICAAQAWVAHSYRLPGDPADSDGLILDGFALTGSGQGGELVVASGGGQFVNGTDFACVGTRRRAIAWVDRDWEGTSIVRMRLLPMEPGGKDDVPATFSRVVPADGFTGVAVAATGRRAWLAWATTGGRIRVQAFDVGRGPSYPVTPRLAMTLPDQGTPTGGIVLAAAGRRVLLAYGLEGHVYARVSTDGGASFGPRRRLLEGCFGCDYDTTTLAADIAGSRMVVHAAGLGGFKDLVIEAYRFVSTSDGASWDRKRRGSEGYRMGAFSVIGGERRLVEAWDEDASTRARKRIRFHREV